ncbi:MAG: ATP-dependent DNA ligase [Nanoarchaeota archaeon]|nr:ATP-dependent DNA ligase [Nanoarchaeota archaeon]MBU1622834.1 ATP-dependent DNA ligase [Nanoarchaeota archaeon]MBU1974419.1 ATP-dependent DNA ligase [Nanoarchaeota archaeon]
MDFSKLVELYEELENTSSGNKLREILAEFFKQVPKEDLAVITYLTLGKISAEYESAVLGLADKTVLKAISVAGGVESSKVKKLMQEQGDAGLVAEIILKKKPTTLVPLGKLTVTELFQKLHQIVETSGTGSQEKKTNILVTLLQKSPAKGAKYIARIALGTLRMGVAEMTVLDALAIAYTKEKKNKEYLEKAYNICPDVGIIAETIAKKGLKGLAKIEISVGRPIKMMLAQRVSQLEDVHKKIPGKFAVEGKYDGERVQAHKDNNGKITLFSRRLENNTNQFPDLVKYLEKQISAKTFIIEAEILAIDEKGEPQPFQVLMQRRRKNDIQEYIKKIPVQAKVFDILYLDGKTVFQEPFENRITLLKKIVKQSKHLTLTEQIITDNLETVESFFQKMLKEGYEGIMMKSLQGEYQAGTRGWNWIKWKKDYLQDLNDTLDLVVVGAFYGKGRRSGTYGALLCAAYDQKNDQFLTVCKLGTGLTDELLAELPQKMKKYLLKKRAARLVVKKEMEADVWFTPHLVVEVLGAELTKSPFHTLGLALRFPRFLRFREKNAEQATTKKELEEMFER